MKKQMFFFFAFLFAYTLQAQNVGIGTTTPDASAALDVSSTTQGTLITRMTTAQRRAITSPAPGLLVYDLDKKTIYMWNSHDWLPFLFAGDESGIPPVAVQGDEVEENDGFGISVSISGNYAVIGAPNDEVGGNYSQGSAYVFKRIESVWSQQAKLVAPDGVAADNFGGTVAISGNYIVVGAGGHNVSGNLNQGCAYVFFNKNGTWIQVNQLVASDGATYDFFGGEVAISGNYIVVGCPGDGVGSNSRQGSAYVFGRTGVTWAQQDKLVAGDGAANDAFGSNVAISGDYIVVGVPNDDIGTNEKQGSAYVYGRIGTNWAQLTKLTSNVPYTDKNRFGNDVDIEGDYIVVGEPGYYDGTLSLFHKGTGWVNGGSYISGVSGPYQDVEFGRSVDLFGDYILVGGNDAQGAGKVYLCKKGQSGFYYYRNIEPGSYVGMYFGKSMSGSGFNMVVGGDNSKVYFLNVE